MPQSSPETCHKKPAWVKRLTIIVALLMAFAYGAAWLLTDDLTTTPTEGTFLYLVGLGAATIASATGLGGGVVFLPAFEFLGTKGHVAVTAAQIVGMSFIIQCFGMTTGSLRWLSQIYDHPHADTGIPSYVFLKMFGLILLCSLPALLITQSLHASPPEAVLYAFKAMSLVLGCLVFVSTLAARGRTLSRSHPTKFDYLILGILSAVGGIATAFFSVGVGELVALYLFLRNFPLITSAALAVMASAASVLVGVWDHIFSASQPWEILIFVIPGAVCGGFLARQFAFWLGSERLKIFAGSWIMLSSAYLLLLG